MADVTYPFRVLRHKFADAIVNKTGTSMIVSAMLGVGLSAGGIGIVVDEMPDNITNEHTAEVYAGLQENLAELQTAYKSVEAIDAKIKTGHYPGTTLDALQTERYRTADKFKDMAVPVISKILTNEALSESQAKDLIEEFSETMMPATDVHRYADIDDYGFLRDARDDVRAYSSDRSDLLSNTEDRVRDYDRDKQAYMFSMFGVLMLFFPMFMEMSGGLRQHARRKPERKIAPKH